MARSQPHHFRQQGWARESGVKHLHAAFVFRDAGLNKFTQREVVIDQLGRGLDSDIVRLFDVGSGAIRNAVWARPNACASAAARRMENQGWQ
jgi:hypothetical protein